MLRIALLNMPFAAYHLPSIGLTQIKSVLDRRFGAAVGMPVETRVETRVVYASLDFAAYMGLDLYQQIGGGGEHLQAGFPEWFFRQAAFPDLPDNADAYFARHYPGHSPATRAFRDTVLAKRRGVPGLLDGIIDRYGLDRCDVVGSTSMFFENMVAFALARRLKERNPAIVTVLGGATCESPSGEEYVRQVPALDYVFSGPALQSFPRFVDNLLAGRGEENDRIPGVFSKANQGRGVPAMGEELDINIPVALDYEPFLDDLAAKLPAYEIQAVLPFETSRGCWWGEHAHCTFCGLNKSTMSYRAMRPDLAVELIRSLFRYAGRASILMCVDNILQRQYVTEVFPYLETPESLAIFYQLKANLTEREVAAMAAARVKLITPGIESLSTATLKLMDKGVSAFHNLQVLKYCSLHDVHPGWNLLVGSPGEGAETYRKYAADLPRLVHLPPPQAIVSIHFNRYSPYFVRAKEYGLDLHPIDYYEMVYPFPPESIENVAYDFMDHNFDADYMRALAEWIGALNERIEQWQQRHADEGGAPPPRLYLRERDGGASVYDSRSGEPREIPLSATGRRVLARLDEPRRLAVLARELSDLAEGELMAEIGGFRDHGLLFEEDDKLMSLILPHEPPPMTFQAGALSSRARRREAAGAAAAVAGPIPRAARRAVKSGAPRGIA
jgi:ribosomal peptide maturation radical SAM protein 1